ncbi:MAG: methyltransferase domain-containing protein [Flavobacteriales bacterium TMED235]|nr:MAG: methyltransferase domain-containing protein [Flavobacteriales bacterium TMED235]
MISKKCRVCNSKNLKNVLSLGSQPLANNLENNPGRSSKYPLGLKLCTKCFNCQLSYIVPSKKLFDKYLYKSSISNSFIKHFDFACSKFIKYFNLNKYSYILDIGSNDGIGLKPFYNRKYKNLFGIEPAKKLSNITNRIGIKTYNCYLNKKLAKKKSNLFNLITASNVFAHVNDLNEFTRCVNDMLRADGIFVIEVQYLLKMLKEGSFDNIYHEHVNFWSVYSLKNFLKKFNLEIFDVEQINTHGGSIRVYIKKKINTRILKKKSVEKFLNKEKRFKINTIYPYEKFKKLINIRKKKLIDKIKKIKKNNNSIIGYGAPAKGSTIINFFKIDHYIDYIIDDNILKNKKFLPNTKLQILNKPKKNKIDYIFVFAWNFFDEIRKKNKKLSKNFVNIFNV